MLIWQRGYCGAISPTCPAKVTLTQPGWTLPNVDLTELNCNAVTGIQDKYTNCYWMKTRVKHLNCPRHSKNLIEHVKLGFFVLALFNGKQAHKPKRWTVCFNRTDSKGYSLMRDKACWLRVLIETWCCQMLCLYLSLPENSIIYNTISISRIPSLWEYNRIQSQEYYWFYCR